MGTSITSMATLRRATERALVRRGTIQRAAWVAGLTAYAVAAVLSGLDRQAQVSPRMPQPVAAYSMQAFATAAQQHLAVEDHRGALPFARRALVADPIDPAGPAMLGISLLGAGDPAGARRAFVVARQMGWRVRATQRYWMSSSLAAGDFAAAVLSFDALARQDPNMASAPGLVSGLEHDPAGRRAIAERLRLSPSWRRAYFSRSDPLDSDRLRWRAEVAEDLARETGTVSCDEVAPLMLQLVYAGHSPNAARLRQMACPVLGQGLVSDGDFRRAGAENPGPFDWQLGSGDADVTASPVLASAGKGGLEITNSAPGRRTVASQYLIIAAGSYRLTWRAISADGSASDRLMPFASCLGGPAALHDIRPAAQSGTWQAAIDIAPDCRGFKVGFEALPGTAQVRLDGVRLVPG